MVCVHAFFLKLQIRALLLIDKKTILLYHKNEMPFFFTAK